MKVSVQYAFSHFDDVSSAVDRGEDVEILRPGKAAIHLVAGVSDASQLKAAPRILGAGRGEMILPTEEEWKAMDKELEHEMCDAPLMTSGEI